MHFYLYLGHRGEIHNKLSLLVSDIPGIGEIIQKMNDANPEALFEGYLYDFVRMVHECNQSDLSDADDELAVSVLYMFCWLVLYHICNIVKD